MVLLLRGGESFTNSITTENITSGISVDAEQRNLYKTSPLIDYNTKQVKWQMDVNMNQYLMDNSFITDTYTNQGLTLVDATFKIYDNQAGIELTANDYKFNKVYDAGVEVGFTVELIGN